MVMRRDALRECLMRWGRQQGGGAYCVGRWVPLLELELCFLLGNSGDDGLIGQAQPCFLTTHQLPQHHSKGIHI